MAESPINWGDDPVVIGVEEIERVGKIARRHREGLVADVVRDFPGREAYAVALALALLFTSSMTEDPAQQADQARILNEIMARWHDHTLPWRLVQSALSRARTPIAFRSASGLA